MKGKLLIALLAVLLLSGCGGTKTVTCDGCGKTIDLPADSKIDNSWIVYCEECELTLFGEDGVVS